MIKGRTLYDNPRIAAGYAFARPAVHQRIVERLRESLGSRIPVGRALDLGCGAGRSTTALEGLASSVVGIDPAFAMLEHRHVVAPRAGFVVGQAEGLPFRDGAFDLVTAAGSINYADLDLALPEVARVLVPAGTFIVYDFSAGRRLAGSERLEQWYAAFERRYPEAPGYAMDVRELPFDRAGLSLEACDAFDVAVPMTLDAYLRYVLSETRVEVAGAAGIPETEIREWCRLTLEDVMDDEPREVIFDAYAARIVKLPS